MTVSAHRAPAVAVAADASGFPGAWRRGEPEAVAFLPRHPARDPDWDERLAEAARTSPVPAVWARARHDGERLGASARSLANADALAAGDALCVTTGQQPGLFLGPLYTAWKAMTAIALAERLARRTRRRVVPVFWNAADDSDFGEVGQAFLPGEGFKLARHALEGGDLPAGGLVGDLGTEGTRRELEPQRADWARRAGGPELLARLDRALERAADHGELASALLLDLFADSGLVVVDGRWGELRRGAAPLFRRWAERRAEATADIVAAGRALEAAGWAARIPEASAERGLFAIVDGRRVPFAGSDAELLATIDTAPETLSPNVALRPLVQDSLFPNVATVVGPGEIGYLAQLAPQYARLEVAMPMLVPRFEATLVPAGVERLAARRGVPTADLVRDFDGTLKATAERALPTALRHALDGLRESARGALEPVRSAATDFDPKLAGSVDEAGRRIADAVEKLHDKAAQAARSAEARLDPDLRHYREFLRPRGVPQERVLSSLALLLEGSEHPLDRLAEPLERHLDAVGEARAEHWLVGFAGRRDDGAGEGAA